MHTEGLEKNQYVLCIHLLRSLIMANVGPLLFSGCAKTLDIGRNCLGHAETWMLSACRDCVQILQYEVMAADEWRQRS